MEKELLQNKLEMFKTLLESPLTLDREMEEVIKNKIATYEKRLQSL